MLAIIRIRGEVHVRQSITATLDKLGLNRVNHLTLKPATDSVKGMLKKAEHYVAYGEISTETLTALLSKRGRLLGDQKIDAAFLKKHRFSSVDELAKQVLLGKTTLAALGIKKVFRLNSPKKGFERGGIKKAFGVGGAAGYRASAINALIQKMA